MPEALANNLRLCLDQAQDLLDAATRVDPSDLPHIAYHLGLLALEEIGKANMIGSMLATGREEDREFFAKSLDHHQRKLQWAIWSPMERFDPAAFEEARAFAERAHARRLASLYVNANAALTDAPPRDIVSKEAAANILKLASSRLELERLREPADPERARNDELLRWFLDIVSDEFQMRHLFSPSFIDQYHTMGNDARAWLGWAREEFIRLDNEAQEAMKIELSRPAAAREKAKPRWRLNATIFTPSHSLRAKTLHRWNESLDRAQLLWIGKKDQFTLQILLTDTVTVDRLHQQAVHIARLVVASLNMGTIGYFWFERAGFERSMFSDIRDLEGEKGLAIELRESFWGNDRALPLLDKHIEHALSCMAAFGSLNDEEAEAIIRPYYDGLALIAKSDILYNFDAAAYRAFGASLAGALALFGGWDGDSATFQSAAEAAFLPIFPNREEHSAMVRHLRGEFDPEDSMVARLRSMKNLTDLYLVHLSYQRSDAILEQAAKAIAHDEDREPRP